MDTRQLTTSDGHSLTADLAMPDAGLRGGVVVCHPHPQYGGSRFSIVVEAVFTRATPAGLAALRFDFRGDHGGGDDEVLDVVAALDTLADAAPAAPLAVVGYSFGAAVALRTDDARIAACAAIAPPLAMMPVPPVRPTLVLTPRHDQFSPPDATTPIIESWADTTFEVIESADHFLAAHAGDAADRSIAWLTERLADAPTTPG